MNLKLPKSEPGHIVFIDVSINLVDRDSNCLSVNFDDPL